jgi:predicted dehydrogenase
MNTFLVVGLGSMGKRRIRCLLALGCKQADILGFDLREDRRKDVQEKYQVKTVKDIKEIDFSQIKAVIVSLPPDKHAIGAKIAIDNNKPAFIEASVVLEDVQEINKYNNGKVYIAPSCTMTYHPMIKDIKNIIKSGKYGKVCNFSYHSGQYLPDWHPWENVNDFYVGQRITGGAREIVPFEFTWIVDLIGFPQEVKGHYKKTIDFGCEIEDSYTCSINYGDIVGVMIVDVAARYAVRNLVINLEEAQIQWRWDKKQIELFEAKTGRWVYLGQPAFSSVSGYNVNIGENMYIEELGAFIAAIDKHDLYPNTLEKDIKVLELLKSIEDSDGGFNRQ